MRELFPGYYRKTESDIKKIWEHGIIMFDTNVLLNLYRYSESTQNTILELIKKFSKQIYLPHQAALEYNRNRYEVIAEQEKAYNEFLNKISQIQKDLQSTNKPPFLTSQVDRELNSVFDKVGKEVKESIQKYCNYLKIDPIYNSISELFENRITDQFTYEELKEIFKEGEERYKNKIPPGFEDEKTKEGNRKYGDLILWKQIIKKAKELSKDVILITDERKADWLWKIKDGRNMGPRQELAEELKLHANVNFHMYSSERFLSYGQEFLNEKVNQQALEEIQAMKKAEIEEINRIEILKREQNSRVEPLRNEIMHLQHKIEKLDQIIQNMDDDMDNYSQRNIDKYYEGEKMDKELPEHFKIMLEHKSQMEEERKILVTRLRHQKIQYLNSKKNIK